MSQIRKRSSCNQNIKQHTVPLVATLKHIPFLLRGDALYNEEKYMFSKNKHAVASVSAHYHIALPTAQPIALGALTDAQFNDLMEQSFAEYKQGETIADRDVATEMHRKYGI